MEPPASIRFISLYTVQSKQHPTENKKANYISYYYNIIIIIIFRTMNDQTSTSTSRSTGEDEWKQHILNQCRANVASSHDIVYNDECVYTFHSPFTSEKGILVNLVTFLATHEDLLKYNNTSGTTTEDNYIAFVRIMKQKMKGDIHMKKKKKTMEEKEEEEEEQQTTVTKLGIGIDGGFPSEKEIITSTYSVVVWNTKESKIELEIPFWDPTDTTSTNPILPDFMCQSVQSILHHVGTQLQQEVHTWELEEDPKPISKFCYTVPFVDNGVTISPNPKDWKCHKDPTVTDNLWLNLSDGYIGGGRKHWDGSGGSNGAIDHYIETGRKYPLVVKLGTITSDPSTADCYSYDPDEDGPVLIPNLSDLLARRGILVSSMQKTVKSTAELEVELNATYAFDAITEAGSSLIPISGPGYQGLQNLGNSCYINTVCQTLFSGTIPELSSKYSPSVHVPSPIREAPMDVVTQTIKLTDALTSGTFASVTTTTNDNTTITVDADDASRVHQYRLAPRMFKHAICHSHAEFRTGQQQDAAHFLQFLLETLDNAEMKKKAGGAAGSNIMETNPQRNLPSHLFAHNILSRIVCSADGKVKYKKDSVPSTILSIRIPKELLAQKLLQHHDDNSGYVSNGEEQEEEEQKQEGQIEAGSKEGGEEDKQQHRKSKRQKSIDSFVPTISFQTCLDVFHEPSTIDDYNWPHLNNQTFQASVQNGLENFPKYLFVQLLRYELGPNWIPIKIEVNVDVPEHVDFSCLKMSSTPKNGEELVPEEAISSSDTTALSGTVAASSTGVQNQNIQSSKVVVDEFALSQLMDMGFSLYGCTRALVAAGGSNVEAAMNWIFEHNMDPDFNDPLPEDGANDQNMNRTSINQTSNVSRSASGFAVDDKVVSSLVESLGCFTFDQVRASLIAAGGAMDRAADWLFSHMDDLDSAIAQLGTNATSAVLLEEGQPQQQQVSSTVADIALDDGEGKYTLIGCISHIGKNVGSGHYVCHLKKDGQWIIYNDEKVAVSQHPPLQHAYIYLFKRDDATFEAA